MAVEYQNERIIVWTSIFIFWFIITPLATYYLYIYYIHRNDMQIKKRHCEITLIASMFCFIFWNFERPLGLIWSSKIWGQSKILTIIHYTIMSFTIYGLLWCFIWRYWLIWYQVKLADATYSNSKWKSVINKNNEQKDWFITNQQTFGNIQWCFKRIFIIFFLCFMLSSISQILPLFNIYPHILSLLSDGCLNLFSFLILLTIYFKTPKFEDLFYIRDELRYVVFAYILFYLCYFIGAGFNILINGNDFYLTCFQTYVAIIFTIIWFYLATRWILRKFDLNTHNQQHVKNQTIDITDIKFSV